MRLRNYIKNKSEQTISGVFEEDFPVLERVYNVFKKRNALFLVLGLLLLFSITTISFAIGTKNIKTGEISTAQLASLPIASTTSNKGVISIPKGTVKVNPFLPYRDVKNGSLLDVPTYDLVEPPEMVNENSDATRIMDTIVSGILYDKYSPSAILNIEGNDYLVKKGDVVNNYKVLNIAQDSVTVKLGANVYKAGIGEILTEGTLNHNTVSNLQNKFGGER